MICLVEKYGEVGFGFFKRPGGDHLALFAVDHCDVIGIGDVHEYARTCGIQAEGFWMPGEFDVGELCTGFGIKHSEATAAGIQAPAPMAAPASPPAFQVDRSAAFEFISRQL